VAKNDDSDLGRESEPKGDMVYTTPNGWRGGAEKGSRRTTIQRATSEESRLGFWGRRCGGLDVDERGQRENF